jgi:lipid-A-disaccharide synthase-like uncharacterized protein
VSTWVIIGFLGQLFFSARFLVQWIVSELRQESVIPGAFWALSLGGGAILTAYAIYRQDPVFIVGQGAGLVVYIRNIMLIRRKRRADKAAELVA